MFEYIKGILESQEGDHVVIENNGFGYRLTLSLNSITQLPPLHQDVCLLLHPAYKEDDLTLYGFMEDEERALFRTLIGISGIGPKVAMGMLSQFSEDELIRHIINEDAKAIARAPGIGKKTAERVILELKDRYKNYQPKEGLALDGDGATTKLRERDNLFNEAVNGLLGLGFAYAEAAALVERIMVPGMTIEEILQKALMSAGSSL